MMEPASRTPVLPWLALSVLLAGLWPGPGGANPADACDTAARQAAAATGVPAEVMLAITRVETGRSRGGQERPWPWTVNMQGRGHWFDSRAEAAEFASRHHAAGARSFDIGCFQLNHRWHGAAFSSIDAMFDPAANARHAARFLIQLKGEFGSWEGAIGAYHSRTPDLAARYLDRVQQRLARPAPPPPPQPEPPAAPDPTPPRRIATAFPLLQAGAPGRLGSLIPAAGPSRGAFITATARGLP